MNILLLLLSGFIIPLPAAEKPIPPDSCFLDSSDLKIIISSKSTILYELEGEPVADSLKKSDKKYIHHYLVKTKKIIGREQSLALKVAILHCRNTSSEMTKCSFLADRCIKFISGNRELLLLLSRNGSCGQQVKVIKINSTQNKETIQSYTAETFNVVYKQ